MTIDNHPAPQAEPRKKNRISLDRHASEYRTEFEELTQELHGKCPVAWNETHDGYWYVSGNAELFDVARRSDVLSHEHDIEGTARGYKGIQIPPPPAGMDVSRGGFLEMDPPAQKDYRTALNPYLSPAAIARWQPFLDEITRACIDEVIESGSVDFVDDVANIVPAVFTLAMLGLPLKEWEVYCEPIHASVYTSPDSPEFGRVMELSMQMGQKTYGFLQEIKQTPRPGLIDALVKAKIDGNSASDGDILAAIMLLIGGGFDTTTALTAHSLEWLSENPDERDRLRREQDTLMDSATEEFLRYYTPAQGDGRTISVDCEIAGTEFKEGDRIWLSWAMSNRDPELFEDPHSVHLDRKGNRHASFGLGIHRCIGSNVARAAFKTMVRHILDRMPDYVCDPEGAVHYDTVGVINGMRKLPATFTPGTRLGPGLEETIATLQRACTEQRLAEPVTVRTAVADI